ncbi:hypothetical protein GCM10023328_02090 [Modestobacter marinus]|uniref:Uncharacterized protein n=1 Tax=Modestobacter marinus TaxID=477641 RepID=A0ABQ2FU53_9ACTN|nr:hypothetical protein GCM10011589_07870 [Modestobacter marinus]
MTASFVPGIAFAGDAPWGAYCQREMGMWAKRPEVTPLAVRILFAAIGRHDSAGHAVFGPGELAEVPGRVDTATGEVLVARKDSVSDAIKAAKRLGFITEESTVRCLVLGRHAFQKGKGAPKLCPVHG